MLESVYCAIFRGIKYSSSSGGFILKINKLYYHTKTCSAVRGGAETMYILPIRLKLTFIFFKIHNCNKKRTILPNIRCTATVTLFIFYQSLSGHVRDTHGHHIDIKVFHLGQKNASSKKRGLLRHFLWGMTSQSENNGNNGSNVLENNGKNRTIHRPKGAGQT